MQLRSAYGLDKCHSRALGKTICQSNHQCQRTWGHSLEKTLMNKPHCYRAVRYQPRCALALPSADNSTNNTGIIALRQSLHAYGSMQCTGDYSSCIRLNDYVQICSLTRYPMSEAITYKNTKRRLSQNALSSSASTWCARYAALQRQHCRHSPLSPLDNTVASSQSAA